MKSRKWVGWVILVAAAILGANWLQADDASKIKLPPVDGFVPTAPPSTRFKPTIPVDDLNKPPVRTNAAEAAKEIPTAVPNTNKTTLPKVTDTTPELPAAKKIDQKDAPAKPVAPKQESVKQESVKSATPDPAIEMPAEMDAPPRGFSPRRQPSSRMTTSDVRFKEESPQTILQTAGHSDSMQDFGSQEVTNRRREQIVSLEWVGPGQIKVGRPFTYELIIRNNGDVAATEVTVRDRVPETMKVVKVEPNAVPDSQGYIWNLGTLAPREERRIEVEMIASQRGDASCHATVTATSNAVAAFRVTQPQLEISQTTPDKMMVGDPVAMTISVNNPGDGPADGVTLHVTLSDGLRHEKGSDFTLDVGTVGAGETKPVQLICNSVSGGEQRVSTVATAEGDIEAKTESKFAVTEAALELAFTGPGLRYLDRQAVYTATVTNPGDAAAENVKASILIPAGFKFVAASSGGRHDFTTSSVVWILGTVNPGETRELSYKAVAIQAGAQKHLASVTGGRGLKKEVEVATRVEGISALLLEVVDIDDPVEVGAETAYEIRVTNQGSREATNVEIHALVPPEMTVRGGQGPTRYRVEGQEVLFAPLPQLAPRADAIYRVLVTGVTKGDVRFRARLISDSLTEPVIEEESTKVYDD
ncbi:DUF11 domain-containing protein [bacterium]|nr:DUF11 domain-containing protein [bacterium]